ncbi:MAG: amidohydrolase family protein [Candidatus Izemoplasmatales bacterium]|jgi:cytosine/adenosine deaminase-related metal-dependent hydrolase
MKTLIHARIFDYHQYIEDGFIQFSDRIEAVGPMKDLPKKEDVEDVSGMLIMPGLIAGHTHIYSAFARGKAFPFNPKNFQEILDQVWWKLDRKIELQTAYDSAIVFGIDHVKSGVTTLIDHHASQVVVGTLDRLRQALAEDIGMRAVLCFETSDRFNLSQAIEENLHHMDHHQGPMISGLFGMHASMSLSDLSLMKIADVLGNRPIHIHVAESRMDQDDAKMKYQMSVIERLNHFDLIQPDSILVHGVHLSDKELDIIREKKAVIALNVSSNMNNGVGLPDYARMKARGIPVIIGNDGLQPAIAQEYQNLVFAMHHLKSDPCAFGLNDLQEIIEETYRYAQRRLQVPLGRIEAGYMADFIVIPYEPPTPMQLDNALGHVFYGLFHRFTPRDVYIQGRKIVDQYDVSDRLKHAYVNARAEAERLWQRIEEEQS